MFTFIGALIGVFSYGFFGGLVGFIIGSIIDGAISRKRSYREAHHYDKKEFSHIILIFTAEVMKADQNLKSSELDYVKQYLRKNYDPNTAQALLLELRDILNEQHDISAICSEVRQKASIHEKLYILQFLFGLAAADNVFDQHELYTIQQISDQIGVSRMDYESIKSMYMFFNQGGGYYTYAGNGANSGSYSSSSSFGSSPSYSLENDYKILEISSDATDDEVKKAFRTLAKKHHPDKVNHLGEEIRKNAEEKFSKLNQAYERIKKSRGMN